MGGGGNGRPLGLKIIFLRPELAEEASVIDTRRVVISGQREMTATRLQMDTTLKVWEALADMCNLDERTARRICREFSVLGHPCDPDALAAKCKEFFVDIQICYNDISVWSSIMMMDEDHADTFKYHYKLDPTKVSLNDYIENVLDGQEDNSINCVFCHGTVEDPVKLLVCPRTCVFCRKCLVPWITEYSARCPKCRTRAERRTACRSAPSLRTIQRTPSSASTCAHKKVVTKSRTIPVKVSARCP